MADDVDMVDESWEALADSGELDKRMENINCPASKVEQKNMSPLPSGSLLQEETLRSTFKPQVKILKRDPQNFGKSHAHHSSNGSGKSYRTLEEREAAYAQARQRIFGSETGGAGEGVTNTNSSNCTMYRSSSVGQQLENLQLSQQPAPQILRQPKAPDGTVGFQNTPNNHCR